MKNMQRQPKQTIPHGNAGLPAQKKQLGQHFLQQQSFVDEMIAAVTIDEKSTILEIGCGDGFLTQAILAQSPCKELKVIEIDPEWASFVRKKITTPRLSIIVENVLGYDFTTLAPDEKLVLLANLPYQITFPIIFKIKDHLNLFAEGVIMIQEEVAQKLVARHGRALSATSLFLQYYFSWKLLSKIHPQAFNPPPKVFSRLVYFKPQQEQSPIHDQDNFWKFVHLCFKSPRQTIKNNLKGTHIETSRIPESVLALRAQQLTFDDFLSIWTTLNTPSGLL